MQPLNDMFMPFLHAALWGAAQQRARLIQLASLEDELFLSEVHQASVIWLPLMGENWPVVGQRLLLSAAALYLVHVLSAYSKYSALWVRAILFLLLHWRVPRGKGV